MVKSDHRIKNIVTANGYPRCRRQPRQIVSSRL